VEAEGGEGRILLEAENLKEKARVFDSWIIRRGDRVNLDKTIHPFHLNWGGMRGFREGLGSKGFPKKREGLSN